MNLVPLGDHVIVRRLSAESKTAGGIVLPDSAQEKPQQGRILAVGDGRRLKDGSRVKSQVSEGDRVVFSTYAGTEFEINGEKLLILDEHEILAIID